VDPKSKADLTPYLHISSIPLLLNWDDVRVSLQKRNRKLTNLRKRYVTGNIKTHNKANSADAKSRAAD